MRTLAQSALTISLGAALFGGCGQMPLSTGAGASSSARLTTQRTHSSATYVTIYSFNGADGAAPYASLLEVNGMLYGVTAEGGDGSQGTVFSITTSGAETVLHNFSGSDGAYPVAGLTNVDGTLYGTTERGGDMSCVGSRVPGCGTIFSVDTHGKGFRVLHSFTGGSGDGVNPAAGLLDVKGTMYGTTQFGGGDGGCVGGGCGTVYTSDKRGEEKVIYRFLGSQGDDGAAPQGLLIDVNRMLYGTTTYGVSNGVVYRISTGGAEQVLHIFRKYPKGDGRFPTAGLVNVNGTLYGTTKRGGSADDGTVYSVSTIGKERVLFSFHRYDGLYPFSGLVDVNGTLYGTTQRGGSQDCKNGCGTLYSVTTRGKQSVLHNFGGTADDGRYPSAALIDVNGTLYGTTSGGGTYGRGTVFALTP